MPAHSRSQPAAAAYAPVSTAAELPATVEIVLRLPDLTPAATSAPEAVLPLEHSAPPTVADIPRTTAVAIAAVNHDRPAAQEVRQPSLWVSTLSTASASSEVHREAVAAVETVLRSGGLARLGTLLGSVGTLLIRPEGRWAVAAAGVARAVAALRVRRAAADPAAEKRLAATVEGDLGRMGRLLQSLAQPNALVASVLALACVLLAVAVQDSRRPAPRQGATVAKHDRAAHVWSDPLVEATVEPPAAEAPPFAAAGPPATAHAVPTQPATPAAPIAAQTPIETPPPPGSDQPPLADGARAPAPPTPAGPTPEPRTGSRVPSPHAARRLPPTAAVNEPLSLPNTSSASQPPAKRMQVFPQRQTDRYGMPVVPARTSEALGPPLEPPSIEPPRGSFDALGPQTVYPMQQTGPSSAAREVRIAQKPERPVGPSSGARLRGIIQPQAAP